MWLHARRYRSSDIISDRVTNVKNNALRLHRSQKELMLLAEQEDDKD
jgi:hypothetical protein